MNSHVSAILLGVKDMERSKRFYTEGLGWKIESDYAISVFFVQHGGSLIGFSGRGGLGGGLGLQRHRLHLRRSQRGPRRRSNGRGQEGRRHDSQARGQAAVGRVRRI